MAQYYKNTERTATTRPTSNSLYGGMADDEEELNMNKEQVPFQRLESESPCPPSPSKGAGTDQATATVTTVSGNSDATDSQEPFASLDCESEDQADPYLRPPSANSNSFTRVIQTLTHSLCGVSVNHEYGEEPYSKDYYNTNNEGYSYKHNTNYRHPYDDYSHTRVPATSGVSNATPFNDTNTNKRSSFSHGRSTSASSLTSHFDKQRRNSQFNSATVSPFPFTHPSPVNVSKKNISEQKPQLQQRENDDMLPHTHRQHKKVQQRPSPFSNQRPEVMMKRSVSTPAPFQHCRRRSAFGKVPSNSDLSLNVKSVSDPGITGMSSRADIRPSIGQNSAFNPVVRSSSERRISPSSNIDQYATRYTDEKVLSSKEALISDSSSCSSEEDSVLKTTIEELNEEDSFAPEPVQLSEHVEAPIPELADHVQVPVPILDPEILQAPVPILESKILRAPVPILEPEIIRAPVPDSIPEPANVQAPVPVFIQEPLQESLPAYSDSASVNDDASAVSMRSITTDLSRSAHQKFTQIRRRRRKGRENKATKSKAQLSMDSGSTSTPLGGDSVSDTRKTRKDEGIIKVDMEKRENISYLPLESEPVITTSAHDDENGGDIAEDESVDFDGCIRKVESQSPIPPTPYQKIGDEHPSPTTHNQNPPLPHGRRVATPTKSSKTRLVLPLGGRESMSPSSYDSASFSRTTRSVQSNNTSNHTFSNYSCNRSVTSSVAEADREVRETNRRELRRHEGIDFDGSMSIQSSDTTSTNPNAYLVLTSSQAQLREGASIPFERFNASSGVIHQHNFPVSNSRRPISSMNARSPITVSSNSIANNTNSSVSTGEEPPRFVSCSSKVAPLPPSHDASLGYSKLGSLFDGKGVSSTSSRSSSSKSSRSKSSKSRKKDKTKNYHKIGSAKIADHSIMRASTPSPSPPCNSYTTSPVGTPISPPSNFKYFLEPDVPKPCVRRQFVASNSSGSSTLVLVSPGNTDGKAGTASRPIGQNWQYFSHDHRGSFHPASILESVVTPDKNTGE